MAVTPRRIDGVDISRWQSGSINFATAAKAGLRWVYHKATEGSTWRDPNYNTRRKQVAKEAGIPFGAYHFARPSGGKADAVEEAKFFLSVAKPQPGDLRPALDLEVTGGLSNAALRTWAAAFIAEVERQTGVKPIVYGPYDLGTAANGCLLWIPRYNNQNSPPPRKWDIWQFSNGVYGVPKSIAGIGNVDLNTMRNGLTVAQMQIPRAGSGGKSVATLAQEVIDGKWGNGTERVRRLTASGYDAKAVQDKVNALLSAPKKTVAQLAQEVIDGKWGNGADRVKRLKAAGHNAKAVQDKVNDILSPKKTVAQLAKEVIAGKWGNGKDRVKRLKAAGYDATAVQNEVNRVLDPR